MASTETKAVDTIIESRRAMLAAGGVALAALAFAPKMQGQAAAAITDNDILNFALNLEYLEAQFYNLAVSGVTIDRLPTPIPVAVNGGTAGTVTLKPNFAKVPFQSPVIQAYATETATEEGKHVAFLQGVLGTNAVSMPSIDLYNSFNTLAMNAGVNGGVFDPFSSDVFFLIGAYVFEDVGVTAYNGAAPLISDKTTVLAAAAGILAVEAYHAGLVRTTISANDTDGSLATITQKISNLRALLANPPASGSTTPSVVDDIGLTTVQVSLNTAIPAATTPVTPTPTPFTASTIVDASASTSLAFSRSTDQVLAIVTGGGTLAGNAKNQGVFFPAGLNGTIK